MSATSRRSKLAALERARSGTVVISYITGTRPGLETMMAMDSIRKIHHHLSAIATPKSQTRIDLILHSNGGDGIVPWRLVTMIREYCKEFNVLVPFRAFSAATLTALGADNIYMHPLGMLGPTDPKVMNEFNPPNPVNPAQPLGINVEDVFSYLSLIKDDVGIRHEDELVKAFGYLAGENRVHPLALGNVKRFYSQSRMMAQKLLELHMDKASHEHRIKEIADNLNSKLYFHGHPINRQEAKQLGLKVQDLSPGAEKALWAVYEEYEKDMKLNDPFIPAILLYGRYTNLPVLVNASTTPVAIDETDLVVAAIDSTNRSDTLYVNLHIEGYRAVVNNTLQDVVNFSQRRNEWETATDEATAADGR